MNLYNNNKYIYKRNNEDEPYDGVSGDAIKGIISVFIVTFILLISIIICCCYCYVKHPNKHICFALFIIFFIIILIIFLILVIRVYIN